MSKEVAFYSKDLSSVARILFLATIFLFFYFSFLYFFEEVSFFIPLITLIFSIFLFYLIEGGFDRISRGFLYLLPIFSAIFLALLSYALYKIFYLNLGYSL